MAQGDSLNAERNGVLAVTVGSRPPATLILYDGSSEADSGFSVLFSDAPRGDDLAADDERMQSVCLHCLIERWPEVGRGLDLAREHGSAERSPDPLTGPWLGRDPETGEWAEN